MKRIIRVLVLLMAALVLMPRTALAVTYPTSHEIYAIASDGTEHRLDADPVQGLSYDSATGVLTMQNYNGGALYIDHSDDAENKCQITIMVKGTNTITVDGKHGEDACIEFVGTYNSVVIRSESGGTLNLNVSTSTGGILAGAFVGGGLTVGGDVDLNINLENKSSSKKAAFFGVIISKGKMLIRDQADVSIKLKGLCLEAYGVTVYEASERAYTVTSSKPVTIDLIGVTGCTTYGVQAQGCTKAFYFAGCPSIMFRANEPFTDAYGGKRPDVTAYKRTSSSTSHEYTPDKSMVPVYRMYNTKTSEHLYTPRKGEYDACGYGSYVDWRQEDVGWWAPRKGASGAKPVYRLYNTKSGDHHYTTSEGEKSILIANYGWVDEGVAYYSGGSYSVYRLYNGKLKRGQHHYTTSPGEVATLMDDYGWSYENADIACLQK